MTARKYLPRTARMFLVSFPLFLLLCSPLAAHFSLLDDQSRIQMDEVNGSFAFFCTNASDRTGPMESGRGPLTSFVVINCSSRSVVVGGEDGRIEQSRLTENLIEYLWRSKDFDCSERFFFVSSTPYDSPGMEVSLRLLGRPKDSGIRPVRMLAVLDIAETDVFDSDRRSAINRFTMWTNLSSIELFSLGRWFRIKSEEGGSPFLAVLDEWKEICANLKDPLLYARKRTSGNRQLSDPALALVWNLGLDRDGRGKRGFWLERFEPPLGTTNCLPGFTGPVTIQSRPTPVRVSVRNTSLLPLKNAVISLEAGSAIENDLPPFTLEEIPALTSVTQKLSCSSASPSNRRIRIAAVCRFEASGRSLVSSLTQECDVLAAVLPVECRFNSNSSPCSFTVRRMRKFTVETQFLRIDDLDGRALVRNAVPSVDNQIVSIPSDRLPAGSAYMYWIEAIRNAELFRSERKSFVTAPESVEVAGNLIIRFPAVNFDYKSAALRSQAYAVLRRVAAILRSRSGRKIRIEGHTDSTGAKNVNVELSLQRATAVRDFLAGAEGFDPVLFVVKGLADSVPIVPNDSEANMSMNRRVEIIVEK